MTYKIWNDIDVCIGCGLCITLCNNWAWNADRTKAKPVKTQVQSLGCNEEAEKSCPVNCIHHEEVGAKKTANKPVKKSVKKK